MITIINWYNVHQRVELLRFHNGLEIEIGNFASFIVGSGGDDTLIGTNQNDFIHGSGGDDLIRARGGDDVAIGGLGNDAVHGEGDKDLVVGSNGDDLLTGGKENDTLSGDSGNDRLIGGTGADILAGGGNDVIITDSGYDPNDNPGDDLIVFGRGDGKDIVFDRFDGARTKVLKISTQRMVSLGSSSMAVPLRPFSMRT